MSGSAPAWHKLSAVAHEAAGPAFAAAVAVALAIALAILPVTGAVLLVIGGVVFVVTLLEPRLGLLLLVPAVPFGSTRQVSVAGLNAGAAEVLLALVIGAWLAQRLARGDVRWHWPPLSLPLGLFVAALALSTLNATSLGASLAEVLKWIEVLVLYVIVANELDARWSRWLFGVVLATGALAALHGIYQFLFQVGPEPFILFGRFMRAYGTFAQPNPYAGYLGLTLPVALGLLAAGILSSRPGARSTTASLEVHLPTGATHAPRTCHCERSEAIPAVTGDTSAGKSGVDPRLRSPTPRGSRAQRLASNHAIDRSGDGATRHIVHGVRLPWLVFAAGCGALMLVALVMSWSRGGWLGFAAAASAIAAAAVARGGRAAVLVTILVAAVLYGVLVGGLARVPPAVTQRFDDFLPYVSLTDVRGREITDANFSVLERMAHWRAAIAMWTDEPWLGVGAGNYEVVYDRYALPLWPLPLGHAHNYYLNIGAEAGVVGLGAYLFLWGAVLWSAWRATRRLTGWGWAVALGVLGVAVHLSVHNLFDNLYVNGMYLHLALLLGVFSFYTRRSDDVGNYHGT